MKAGHELDCLIAEQIMDYKRGRSTVQNYAVPSEEITYRTVEGYFDPTGNFYEFVPCTKYCNGIPPFSTNIASAWKILEKLWGMSEGGEVKVSGLYNGLYFCTIEFHGSRTGKYFDAHDTAPMAICLAALKTVEKK